MEQMFRRSLGVYRDGGLASLLRSSRAYVLNGIEDAYLKYKYRLKYGDVAPRPAERRWVDPRHLEYTLEHSRIYNRNDRIPNYGILDGDWDLHKGYWRTSTVWGGLIERFEEGKRWEDTSYYQLSMEKLRANEYVGYLDGPQTTENFERYLEELDRLYEDMKHNGYDPSSVITVYIGRDGDWIVGHGNHRRALANVLGIESVPVEIKYRHQRWQNIRQRIHRADSIEQVRDIEEFLEHPDTPAVTSD